MILVPIVDKYSSFTSNEQKIADFILSNPQGFLKMNATQLGEITETSPAALVRFAKKIGFDGFSDMKIGLASFTNDSKYPSDILVTSKDSQKKCAEKLIAQIDNVCKATFSNINMDDLSSAVEKIYNAQSIYLMGVGSSGTAAMNLQYKLIMLYKKVFYIQDSQINLLETITMTKKDVVIAFSHTGNTKIIEVACQTAKNQGAAVIALTGNEQSPVGKIADICLKTYGLEKHTSTGAVSSFYSQQYISDLLYLSLVASHYEDMEKVSKQVNRLISNI